MHHETFFRKKQLLARRDKLLEEIGQKVFEQGDLPSEFAMLPKEFKGMDILLTQLKDRFRTLREERERVSLDLRDVIENRATEEGRFKREVEPARQRLDELELKLKYRRDGLHQGKISCQQLETEIAEIKSGLSKQERTFQTTRDELAEAEKPLEQRIIQLERGIGRVQEESERLRSNRRKRLRDLGYWYHGTNQTNAACALKFGQLDLVSMELAEFNQKDENQFARAEEPGDLPPERDSKHWRIPLALLLAILVLGYYFRTQFREDNLDFGSVAHGYMADQRDFLLYADFSAVDHQTLEPLLPTLTKLPGGGEVFRDMQGRDLLDLVIAKEGGVDGKLLYCGVRFRRAPARFALRLASSGWDYHPSVLDWKAISDGTWIWLILNEKSFFLFPRKELPAFEKLAMTSPEVQLLLEQGITPPGNNHRLLQGYEKLRFALSGSKFHLSFDTTKELPDLEHRLQWLNLFGNNKQPLDVTLEGKKLSLSGNPSSLTLPSYNETHLKQLALDYQGTLYEGADAQITVEPASLAGMPATQERLLVFSGGDKQARQIGSMPLGQEVQGLAYDNIRHGLIVLGRGSLVRYKLAGNQLAFDCRLSFDELPLPDGERLTSFEAGRMALAPNGEQLVVLEQANENKRRPRILLVSADALTPLSMERVAVDVIELGGLAWRKDGSELFLAATPNRRRGNLRRALMTYSYRQEVLNFEHFLPLSSRESSVREASFRFTDLVSDEEHRALYLMMWPQERLYRRDMSQDGLAQRLDLRQSLAYEGAVIVPNSGLVLNRTNSLAVLVGTPEGPVKTGEHALYLIDLAGNKLTLLDSFDPGFIVSNLWRQPLSDHIWVSGESSLLRLSIEARQLVDSHLFPELDVTPRYMCSDALGRYVFTAGSRGGTSTPMSQSTPLE